MDVMEFTKDAVVKDLQDEGYKHDFFFGNFHDCKTAIEYMKNADEVWCFGDCKDLSYFIKAKDFGCDIWQMR